MNLYSRKRFLASTLLVLACAGFAASAVAQKRKAHKLRATAVVEVTTDSKGVVTTHVFPVTILDNGLFNDASIYKATPRPMALENGIVYEAQTLGMPVGTATIISGANADGWSALGKWQVVKVAPPKPDASPTPVTFGSDRPTLHRAAGSESSASPSTPSPSPTPAPGTAGDSSGSGSGSSDDRPVLHRPASSSTEASPTPTPAASGTPASGSPDTSASNSNSASTSSDRPTLHPPTESASPTPSPTPAASGTPAPSTAEQSPADSASAGSSSDPDRPTLRRRDSPQPEGPPQPPASEQKSAQSSITAPTAKKPVIAPGTTKVFAAISDTEYLEPRSFDFKWKPDEAKDMELKMRKLALAQIPKQTPQPTKESAHLTPNSLKNVVIRSFDLDLSNDAVIVLSAEIPATVPSTKESDAKFISRYVTVIARVDFEGEPQKVLANVTDSSRLDVTPRMELIDAIDVDGDGNAELLFREYGDRDKSFIIYSIGRSIANKLFEGASSSLKAGS